MSKTWTNEKLLQMLLIIIKRHYSGTPDFEYVAGQLGVTKDAARVKFNLMKREFAIPGAEGLQTPPSSPGKKRKAKGMKMEDKEAESEESGEEKPIKRPRSVRGAAVKAIGKLENIEEDEFLTAATEYELEE